MGRYDVERVFIQARAIVARRFPKVLGYGLWVGCPWCEEDHRRSSRQYCHVGHVPGYVCSSRHAERLGDANLMGLFLHEFGHVVGGPEQEQADNAIVEYFGIPILYDHRTVQFVEV